VNGFLVDLGRMCADAFGGAAGVLVGRGAPDRGAGAAGGSRGAGPAAGRPGDVGANRGALAVGVRADRPARDRSGASDDRDGDIHQVDGAQSQVSVGVPGAGGGGVGLDSSATVLSNQPGGAGARRVDGPEAHPAAGGGDGERDHARVDRGGNAVGGLCRGRCGSIRR
jgi:hypothetical protein